MPADRNDLESLFAPPVGLHGTHALLCGLSANIPVLERIMSTFTAETPVERQASGLVRCLLLLDASSGLLSPTAVPGLMQMSQCVVDEWKKRTTLMHAKVALLGFGETRCSAPERWRLLVSTGNWTDETWSRQAQIDFFWTADWAVDDKEKSQELSDVQAAFGFFRRLLDRLYGDATAKLKSQPMAIDWLDLWSKLLTRGAKKAGGLPPARFIHTLDASIATQVHGRFPASGVNSLVAGSGFFEQALKNNSDRPTVLKELEKLGKPGSRYLVFNMTQAGQIANWVGKRKLVKGSIDGWQLCNLRDPLQKNPAQGRTNLHAKYLAGLGPVRDEGKNKWSSKIVFLYLGSGNLSKAGYMSTARLGGRGAQPHDGNLGNVEAGVVLTALGKYRDVFRALACGGCMSGDISSELTAGPGEDIFVPKEPLPILFARQVAESDQSPARLVLERSAVPAHPLWIQDAEGRWVPVMPDAVSMPWAWPAAPTVLRVRSAEPGRSAGQEWEVPVFSDEGLYCKRPVPQLTFSSVLKALLAFPAVPPTAIEDDDEEGGNGEAGKGGRARRAIKASPYPLRSYASMIEAIASRNMCVEKEAFAYWLSQMRVLLLEQASDADRESVRGLGVDLFDALMQEGFKPAFLDKEAALASQYAAVIELLRAAWCAQPGRPA